MSRGWWAALCLLAGPAWAAEPAPTPAPELTLVSEHPVEGFERGNLSGLAWCGDALWAVSDRDDRHLYRLDSSEPVWRAEAEAFQAPPAPNTGLPWGTRVRTWVSGQVRGGELDFEGLSCDSRGNRYLVSEAYAAVLQINPAGMAQWLTFPSSLVRQARASGMLLKFNAGFEGVAVDPAADRLWLAAERERRGLLVLHRNQSSWRCTGGCILTSEGGLETPPAGFGEAPQPRSFSDLAFFDGKLFTLERPAHQICRRLPATGAVERCWSLAATAGEQARRYANPFGAIEALVIDAEGAWVGLDNNGQARPDGDRRPVVWRFAAPKGGWSAKQ
ncbi:esterase-like activity of phytase family protein [Stutzerimonas azotifigens]|uniref:esterase-like activity of phytase family protein n=1 Tax=Stutzerimonas azotifigens TaxID=291995 RepID=UPI000408BE08|nr:esterase-like activity of phytase family protein [Stutzerimonas azotifigens]